jgi:hypothetical protein
MPNKKRGTGYDERPDPRGPGQQGVLFRREAPARANLRAERDHLGPTPEDQAQYIRHRDFGRYGRGPDQNAPKPEEYDLRALKGRVTGLVSHDEIRDGLYHGTAARLNPGSMIRPGQTPNFGTNGQNWGNGQSKDVNRENAFATGGLANAYHYAQNAREMRETRGNVQRGNARAHVYRVQPTGPVSFDAEDEDARMGYGEGISQFQSKHPFRVMNHVQFGDAQEAYRSHMEDELGDEPGQYKYAPPVRQGGLW